MPGSAIIVSLFTHFVPIMFLMFMMVDVFLRNPNRTEHRLVSGIIFCCMMLFMAEFVRHLLPIEYSPIVSASWFSTSGIIITGLGLHLFVKLTYLEHKFPKYVYPYVFYLPIVIVLLNLFFNDQMISGNEFQQVGIWKLPIYNEAYYIAQIASNFFNILYLIVLWRGIAHAYTREQSRIYILLMIGVTVTLFFNLVIGLLDFKGYLPPYPYIYGGIAWCVLLRYTMLKYDFLNFGEKRYERLFNLSPAAIILIDLDGNTKEANPSARQMFANMNLDESNFYSILSDEIKQLIANRKTILHCEMSIQRDDKTIDVLIDGDYIYIEHVPHLILIVRDITSEKENERKISFLAYHDTLTHLPNRRVFYKELEDAILDAKLNDKKLAVALFDLDHFKEINDQYGHHVGDEALVHLANQIRKVMTPPDLAVRLGGDEFAVLFTSADSPELIKEKFNELRSLLEENKLIVDDQHIPLHLSIGISFFPENGHERMELMRNADNALYYVKRNGRNSLAFSAEMY